MIFLDTNVFLRFLVEPETPEQQEMMEQAARLMAKIADGQLLATTSDAVIAEVFYALTGREYRMPIADAITTMGRLLQMRGLNAHQKSAWIQALEIWSERPGLGFVDSLGAAYSLVESHHLATFDVKLRRVAGLSISHPEEW